MKTIVKTDLFEIAMTNVDDSTRMAIDTAIDQLTLHDTSLYGVFPISKGAADCYVYHLTDNLRLFFSVEGDTIILKNIARKEAILACKPKETSVAQAIVDELALVQKTLLEKNAAYGNSALDPVRIFSKANPVEQLLVRIDDKLSRLARGADAGDDTVLDLIGYLVLLRIAKRDNPCRTPARW